MKPAVPESRVAAVIPRNRQPFPSRQRPSSRRTRVATPWISSSRSAAATAKYTMPYVPNTATASRIAPMSGRRMRTPHPAAAATIAVYVFAALTDGLDALLAALG